MKMLIVTLGMMLSAGSALGQTTVKMRDNAAVAVGAAVKVSDVAAVAGPDSERLGPVVVINASKDQTALVDRAAVKAALDKAGVNWATTTLTGGTTSVKFGDVPAGSSDGSLVANVAALSGETANPPSRGTLQELIGVQIAAGLDVRRDEVRVRFDGLGAADLEWARQPVQKGWQYEVRTIGASLNGRTPVRVEAYDRDRLALGRTITLEVLVQRQVAVAATMIAKDQVLTADDVSVQTSWMPINQGARAPGMEELIGSCAKRRIDAGKPIGLADVQAPVVVKRGDEVWVHCISGGMVVKTKARAMGPGRNGELVNFQVDGSRKTFSARMNGRGRAVMNLDGVADEGATSELSSAMNGSQR